MPDVVEVRCPLGPQRLLTKLRLAQGAPRYVQPGNLIEMSCEDCRGRLRRRGRQVTYVLHRYNFLGELVHTVLVDGDGHEHAPDGGATAG